jgi:O-antigen/teichoic acid export membrane protein
MSSTGDVERSSLLVRLAVGTGTIAFGSSAGKLLLYLYNVLLARLLGPESFGVYFLAYTIIFNGTDIVTLINTNTTMRFAGVYFHQGDARRLKGLTTLSVATAALVGFIGALALTLAGDWAATSLFRKPELGTSLPYFAWTLVLLGSQRIAASTLIAIGRPGLQVLLVDVLSPLILLASLPVILWQGVDPLIGASIAYPLSVGISLLVVLLVLTRRSAFLGSVADLPRSKIVEYSGVVYLMSNFNNLTRWADVLLVGYFLTGTEGGIYAAALQFSLMNTLLIKSFDAVFGPVSATLFSSRRINELRETFVLSTKWSVMFTLPFLIVAAVAGDRVLTLFYGPEYAEGHVVMAILVFGTVIQAATMGASRILTTSNNERRELLNVVMGGIAAVVLNAILIPAGGLIGASVGKTMAFGFIQTLRLSRLRAIFEDMPGLEHLRKSLLAAGCAIVAALSTRFVFDLNLDELGLFVAIVIGSLALYLICLQLLGWDESDQLMLASVERRFKRLAEGAHLLKYRK